MVPCICTQLRRLRYLSLHNLGTIKPFPILRLVDAMWQVIVIQKIPELDKIQLCEIIVYNRSVRRLSSLSIASEICIFFVWDPLFITIYNSVFGFRWLFSFFFLNLFVSFIFLEYLVPIYHLILVLFAL